MKYQSVDSAPFVSDEVILKWVRSLRQRRFFGKTVLCWENGKLVHVKMEETLTMHDLKEEIQKDS